MSTANLAWLVRTAMVTVSAICAFVLAQSEVPIDPVAKLVLGGIIVAISAINPETVARRFGGPDAVDDPEA